MPNTEAAGSGRITTGESSACGSTPDPARILIPSRRAFVFFGLGILATGAFDPWYLSKRQHQPVTGSEFIAWLSRQPDTARHPLALYGPGSEIVGRVDPKAKLLHWRPDANLTPLEMHRSVSDAFDREQLIVEESPTRRAGVVLGSEFEDSIEMINGWESKWNR